MHCREVIDILVGTYFQALAKIAFLDNEVLEYKDDFGISTEVTCSLTLQWS